MFKEEEGGKEGVKEGRETRREKECRPYTASLKNTEGDGFLYNMSLPNPPAPVLHKHRGLPPAPIRTLQQEQQAPDRGTAHHMESGLNQSTNCLNRTADTWLV